MLRGLLMVDLAHKLSLVVIGLLAKSDFPAGVIRLREARHNFQRDRTERRRIDPVVHIRSPQRKLPAAVAGRRRDRRKVTREHRSRWNELPLVGRILAEQCLLISAEEE